MFRVINDGREHGVQFYHQIRDQTEEDLGYKVKSFSFSQENRGSRLFPARSVLVFPPTATPSSPPKKRYVHVLIPGNL